MRVEVQGCSVRRKVGRFLFASGLSLSLALAFIAFFGWHFAAKLSGDSEAPVLPTTEIRLFPQRGINSHLTDAEFPAAVRGNANDETLFKHATAGLRNPSSAERCKSLRLLGLLGNAAAVEPISKLLKHDFDTVVRSCAARALGKLPPDNQTAEALRDALSDRDDDVRCSAIAALVEGEGMNAAEILRHVAHEDRIPLVRVNAIEKLIELGLEDEELIGLLRDMLPNLEARAKCEEVLERRGKLELPLPPQFYVPIDRDQYLDLVLPTGHKPDARVERSVTKNGKVYFELVSQPGFPHMMAPVERRWYVAPAMSVGAPNEKPPR